MLRIAQGLTLQAISDLFDFSGPKSASLQINEVSLMMRDCLRRKGFEAGEEGDMY